MIWSTVKNGIPTASGQAVFPKSPTGIFGFDDITGGGLPRGRTTLVCGGPGCGKTIFGTEFLVRGAREFGEPGVFVSFEETAEELEQNVASLGFDLGSLIEQQLLHVDFVFIERSEIEETGDYDLSGLFVRLQYAIEKVGAKRIVLDTLEALYSGLSNESILRAELRRLFRWLKDRGITAIVTAERGDGALTRHGLEEYVSDCVILLDHRVNRQMSIRRLRVVKYRGSTHGTNEYPFLLGEDGVSVLPITSIGLAHDVTDERISTGVAALDEMMEGKGYYKGSSILISGTAGTGKSSLAAHLVEASCARGERCLFLAFEESPQQIVRNMRSIGIDLQQWIDNGLLHIRSARPSLTGLEMHLVEIHKLVSAFDPSVVVIDPISNFITVGDLSEVQATLTRLVDFLKVKKITALFTSLTEGGVDLEGTDIGISSIIDTWILVKMIERGDERIRSLYVLKSRGMAHSHRIRQMVITSRGVDLEDGGDRLENLHREDDGSRFSTPRS